MTAKTHLLAGMLAGELVCSANSFAASEIPFSALIIGVSALGALLPDIDHSRSRVSSFNRSTKNSAWMLGRIFHHRGPIHSPMFLFLLLLAGWFGGLFHSPKELCLAEGFSAGWLTHLLLDTLNPRGILWLWPLSKKRFHIGKIRVGAFGESILAVLMLILIVSYSSLVPAFRLNLSDIWHSLSALGVRLWESIRSR